VQFPTGAIAAANRRGHSEMRTKMSLKCAGYNATGNMQEIFTVEKKI